MPEQLLKLPEKPGTVIAIGDWWLVRLRPYGSAPSAWELLPMPDDESSVRAEEREVRTQCIYSDLWVLAEAEQEGGYVVISDPREVPSGVRYFRQEERADAEPEPRPVWDGLTYPLPIGARVRHTGKGLRHLRGEVAVLQVDTSREPEKYTGVHWDGQRGDSGYVSTVQVQYLEPEGEQ